MTFSVAGKFLRKRDQLLTSGGNGLGLFQHGQMITHIDWERNLSRFVLSDGRSTAIDAQRSPLA